MSALRTNFDLNPSVANRVKPPPPATVLPKSLICSKDFGAFDEDNEFLIYPTCRFIMTKCNMCSLEECKTITHCCGLTLCSECLETEGCEKCFNCEDALYGIVDVYDNTVKENPFFKGAEPRCLTNDGRKPVGLTRAFIDLYGISRVIYSLPNAASFDTTKAMVLPKSEFKRIYWGTRSKCCFADYGDFPHM